VVRLALIGVPSNSSGRTDGVARAPSALRAANLLSALAQSCDVEDFGDVPLPEPDPTRDPITGLIDPGGFAATVDASRAAVSRARSANRFPLVLGGDCPVLLGCLAGSGSRGVLFVDGHEDAYPPHLSQTGKAADSELALALGLAPGPKGASIPMLGHRDVAILGARDGHLLREQEVGSLRGTVAFVDDSELRVDPEMIAARALAPLPRPWWLHLDLDVLSTEALPSVDYPQAGGIGWLDLLSLTREALAKRPIGWDITIYDPDLDRAETDARRIVRFLGETAALLQ